MPLNENAKNEILPFATGASEAAGDLMPLAEYQTDTQRTRGFSSGLARRSIFNRAHRQAAHMAAGLAQFLANRYAAGVADDGDLDKIEAALAAVIAGIAEEYAVDVGDALDVHAGQYNAHGAASAATPGRAILRDAEGRAQVAEPEAAADIARKDTVDKAVVDKFFSIQKNPTETSVLAWANAQTVGSAVFAPSSTAMGQSADAPLKGYGFQYICYKSASGWQTIMAIEFNTRRVFVRAIANGQWAGTWQEIASQAALDNAVGDVEDALNTHAGQYNAHGATSAASAGRIMARDASGRAQVAAPAADADIARLDTVQNAVRGTPADSAKIFVNPTRDQWGLRYVVFGDTGVTAASGKTPLYVLEGSGGAQHYNVLTFGSQSRLTQIAIQAYTVGGNQNRIFIRSRHMDDSDMTQWQAWQELWTLNSGPLPIARGGTAAADRMQAVKNLLGADLGGAFTHVLTITNQFANVGYTSRAEFTDALGRAPMPQAAAGVGQVVKLINTTTTTTMTLPAGGTWWYWCFRVNSAGNWTLEENFFQVGIAAGGTVVSGVNTGAGRIALVCWRIA